MSRCALARLTTVTVVSLSILLGGQSAPLHAQATFNMDLLEKTTICRRWICSASISKRSQPPGDYPVSWQVNGVTWMPVRSSRFARMTAGS
ncbi:hypothetical protein LNP25_23735 [Klebsiella variicola subsp. variicola]|nr:hypothetical protein [Klebsiella variicola subsp. variicola]